MINSAELKNFGPIKALDWQNLGKINLIIGNNGCGKSFVLKALYSAMRTLEDYKRNQNADSIDEILKRKLHWTFQAENIGDLVTKPSDGVLSFSLIFSGQNFSYSFSNDNTNVFDPLENQVAPRTDNSIFLPAKEILSLHHIILNTRNQYLFGFDDTYFDLALALLQPPTETVLVWGNGIAMGKSQSALHFKFPSTSGHNSIDFNDSRMLLEDLIEGRIEFDGDKKQWYFIKDEQRFPMGVTAEGIRKVAVLDSLLGNRHLNENSIIFIDEPESALHPEAIDKLLDIVAMLAQHGIQFFLASHSYFVIKKLFLIAQEQQLSIPVLSYQNDEWVQSDLKDEMPSNPIISESIRLYKEEVTLACK
ncbi:MAG: ATP-binding protein [Methylococcaceae bacterium]|nr:ATP-binding protein [Methylococcaceae bacterium]